MPRGPCGHQWLSECRYRKKKVLPGLCLFWKFSNVSFNPIRIVKRLPFQHAINTKVINECLHPFYFLVLSFRNLNGLNVTLMAYHILNSHEWLGATILDDHHPLLLRLISQPGSSNPTAQELLFKHAPTF